MAKKVWLDEVRFRAIMQVTRPACLYEVDRKVTYWHRKPNGYVLGPRVSDASK